jgi:DNA-binding NarL/FixJ family response regulator
MLTASAGEASEAPRRCLSVVVIDDHPVVCRGVALLLQGQEEVVLAGSARSGEEAVALVRQTQPDLVLLDLRLPDMLAPEVVPRLRLASPDTKIVVFTAYASHAALPAVLRSGAEAVILKDVGDDELVDILVRVNRGERVVDERLSRDLAPGRCGVALATPLTRRELEVLRRVAVGETNAEIACATSLSPNTVKTYLQTAFQKLGARNRVEAIARAREAGVF